MPHQTDQSRRILAPADLVPALETACSVLHAASSQEKAALAEHAKDLVDGVLCNAAPSTTADAPKPPKAPSRPEKPVLAPPGAMPRRRLSSVKGRIALLHAVAHIEFNAINLAFDMAVRFTPSVFASGLDAYSFTKDWINVGADEARHFQMIEDRLNTLGAAYGDLPAHNGLWEAADATMDDVLARLAIAPMVLEARGLDVTPAMIEKLINVGDEDSAALLTIIYNEEIGHVAAGRRWFEDICAIRGVRPLGAFHTLVENRFAGILKPPFNHKARQQAGMAEHYYADLATEQDSDGH